MRTWGKGLLGLAVLCATGTAQAESLLDLSGKVAMGDGTAPTGATVLLGLDLNRDGELQSFETLRGTVDTSGSYQVTYELDPADVDLEFVVFAAELIADYNARGFEALLDDGPLPLVISFEREGYSTITTTLSTLLDNPRVDALLTPLQDIQCTEGGCRTPSGGVEISGFPGGTGIARAYAETYDPALDTSNFPGSFSDSNDNLLISTGFVEVDLRDASGKRVTELSKEVEVRFEAHRHSWHTMRDLEPGNGRIDVPMYSFNEVLGQWVAESDGVLESTDGTLIAESDLAEIREGTFSNPVFIRFQTKHFSTFNCDAPVQRRACVKGRLLDENGNGVSGVSVSVDGVNYTGSAGTMITEAGGYFAADLMKSEEQDEDVDRNGETGQTFTARVSAWSALGAYVGATFDSPQAQGSIGGNRPDCRPAECECLDLGSIEVEFEEPRACRITVHATYSGESVRGETALAAGDPIENAKVSGRLAGRAVPASSVTDMCANETCFGATTNSDGTTTFIVPLVGEAPSINVSSSLSLEQEGEIQYYTGSTSIDGCVDGVDAIESTVELELDHVALDGLGEFIAALGDGPAVGGFDEPKLPEPPEFPTSSGCGCTVIGLGGSAPPALLGWMLASIFVWRRRGTSR